MPEQPWPERLAFWYFRRPAIGYGLMFAVTALAGLLPRSDSAIAFGVILLPWIGLGIAVLNLPFVAAAWRGMTLSGPVRRNHALEHGTIHFLIEELGHRRISGRASNNGFRVAGIHDPDQVRRAFSKLMDLDREEWRRVVVAAACGSSIIVAQGLAIVLLLLTLLAFIVWDPSRLIVGFVLVAQMLLWVLLRAPIGRWLQWNRLLSTDFESAKIRDIRKVSPRWPFTLSPAYFVRTVVK